MSKLHVSPSLTHAAKLHPRPTPSAPVPTSFIAELAPSGAFRSAPIVDPVSTRPPATSPPRASTATLAPQSATPPAVSTAYPASGPPKTVAAKLRPARAHEGFANFLSLHFMLEQDWRASRPTAHVGMRLGCSSSCQQEPGCGSDTLSTTVPSQPWPSEQSVVHLQWRPSLPPALPQIPAWLIAARIWALFFSNCSPGLPPSGLFSLAILL